MKKNLLFVFLLAALVQGAGFAAVGDANSNGAVDIVDALVIAQFYVGLNPANLNQQNAEVSGDGKVDIVDALLIARFYVGLISQFPVQTQTTYTLTIAVSGNGSTNPGAGTHTYNSGTAVSITATAGSGASFTGWSGSATGSANPLTLTMSSNMSVTANFTSGTQETIANLPSNYKSSLDWIWTNRIQNEGSTNRKNLIFDQIYAAKGAINYCVRWQSSQSVTLQQRQEIASMIVRQLTNWTKHLANYDGWPYPNVQVKVVSWACVNSSLILDKQSNEILYTDYSNDPLNNENPSIPIQLPNGPSTCSRFDHFTDPNYTYSSCPGGSQNRFDMYLWGTTNFGGGAGGDWGQRVADTYILSNRTATEALIIEHEIGHGFGLTDFYGESERPPGGFPAPTIMWAGNSSIITDYDKWMLRYVWSKIKTDTSRFPPR